LPYLSRGEPRGIKPDSRIKRLTSGIERLTREKNQSGEGNRKRLIVAIVIGVVALGISIGIGYNNYTDIESRLWSANYSNSQLQTKYDTLLKIYNKSKEIYITSMKTGNWNNRWITEPGGTLKCSEVYRLRTLVKYMASVNKTATFDIKWYYPENDLRIFEDTARSGYTYSITRNITTNGGEFDLGFWGWDKPGQFPRGSHKIEVWYEDVCLSTDVVELK
jgi:hypothetical protein